MMILNLILMQEDISKYLSLARNHLKSAAKIFKGKVSHKNIDRIFVWIRNIKNKFIRLKKMLPKIINT